MVITMEIKELLKRVILKLKSLDDLGKLKLLDSVFRDIFESTTKLYEDNPVVDIREIFKLIKGLNKLTDIEQFNCLLEYIGSKNTKSV